MPKEIGQDTKRVLKLVESDTVEKAYSNQTDVAREKGIFGSPTCVVDGELFWGDDRIEDAVWWLKNRRGMLVRLTSPHHIVNPISPPNPLLLTSASTFSIDVPRLLVDLLVGQKFLFVRQHRRIEGDRDFEGGAVLAPPPVAQG